MSSPSVSSSCSTSYMNSHRSCSIPSSLLAPLLVFFFPPTLSSSALFFRLPRCLGSPVLLCSCTLPVRRNRSFSYTSARLLSSRPSKQMVPTLGYAVSVTGWRSVWFIHWHDNLDCNQRSHIGMTASSISLCHKQWLCISRQRRLMQRGLIVKWISTLLGEVSQAAGLYVSTRSGRMKLNMQDRVIESLAAIKSLRQVIWLVGPPRLMSTDRKAARVIITPKTLVLSAVWRQLCWMHGVIISLTVIRLNWLWEQQTWMQL